MWQINSILQESFCKLFLMQTLWKFTQSLGQSLERLKTALQEVFDTVTVLNYKLLMDIVNVLWNCST